MDEKVKHRIIGGTVLAIMAFCVLPFLLQTPSNPDDDFGDFSSRIEPIGSERKIVEAEENYQDPAPVARVNLDSEQEVIAQEEIESQAVVQAPKFSQPKTESKPVTQTTETQKAEVKSEEAKPIAKIQETPAKPIAQKVPAKSVVKATAKAKTAKPKAQLAQSAKSKGHKVKKAIVMARKAKPKPIQKHGVRPAKVWVVQMASFTDIKNAIELRDKLRNAGFRAFIRDGAKPDGKVYKRVLVGPEVKRSQAALIEDKIFKQFHMHGMTVHYSPIHG